jgi:hypothetical protein
MLEYKNVKELFAEIPGFADQLEAHILYYDELLGHLLLADVVRYLQHMVKQEGAQSDVLHSTMRILETWATHGDDLVQELLVVSFIENLDDDDVAIHQLFGPQLQKLFDEYCEWWSAHARQQELPN